MTVGDYLPVLFLIVLASAFAGASLFVASKLSPSVPVPTKLEPYESGIIPEAGTGDERFPIKFYLVAMLFIIFDIETVFLFPWAVAYDSLGLFGLIEMGVFIGILLAAFAYVWRGGGLEWAE